jgi:hypothetical protein
MGLPVAWAFMWRPDGAWYEEVRPSTDTVAAVLSTRCALLPRGQVYSCMEACRQRFPCRFVQLSESQVQVMCSTCSW